MDEIHESVQADTCIIHLSGSHNWRKDFYPEYKANRTRPPPRGLQEIREFLIMECEARVTDGIEADDALGMDATDIGTECVICSIDKDLLQIPGRHYNFVKKEWAFVTPVEGLRTFYKQLILGDRSDNVPGYDGMARQKPTRRIQQWFDEIDMFDNEIDMLSIAAHAYNYNKEALERSAKLLYIWRKENDEWKLPPEMEFVFESSQPTVE